MIKQLSLSELRNFVGKEIGVSKWLEIDQERIDRFASATEDYQWIHVDAEKAEKAFGSTIAHGFLTLSLIPHLGSDIFPVPAGTKMSLNYGLNRVRMISPVPVGASIRDVVVLTALKEKDAGRILMTTQHTIEMKGAVKPACVAEFLIMYIMDV